MKYRLTAILAFGFATLALRADTEVYLLNVPDYRWYAGCFGTASGNLIGFWDRCGLSGFYTGPTGGGFAPMDSRGTNSGIQSLWASKAGVDGRPADQPGHIDDYWVRYNGNHDYSYEDTGPDPHVNAGRPEHAPDCIGDFIGLSQRKWTNMNGECSGNIDAYSFVFWETNGLRRTNHQPTNETGAPIPDIPSGLRAWARHRGYDAEVYSQLTDFNPTVPAGRGFTFANLKAEIDAGYPVLVFLQHYSEISRNLAGLSNANPVIHGMLIYGYSEYPGFGLQYAHYRTSGGDGDGYFSAWTSDGWWGGRPVRGVIGFHPRPRILSVVRGSGQVTIEWDGPSAERFDALAGTTTSVHRYQLERATSLDSGAFSNFGAPTISRSITMPDSSAGTVFYRVKLLPP